MASTTPDYSNNPLIPTPISWIVDGAGFRATISNSVGGSDTKDYVTFTIPVGQSLSSFELSSYSSTDGVAFIALQPGTSITGSSSNTAPFSGYDHFGNYSSIKAGSSLIALLGSSVQSASFSAWIQQLGASTDYSFTLKTAPVTDTTPPTIAIAANKTNLKAGDTAQIIFTLSEPSTDFILADVTVVGGALSNFSGSGTNYTAIFSPTENSTTPGSVSVTNLKFSDAAGNQNVDGADANNAVSITTDTLGLPVRSVKTKHYYDVVVTQKEWVQNVLTAGTWDAAKTAAASMTYRGLSGYLATVTSREEQDTVEEVADWRMSTNNYIQSLGTNPADGNDLRGGYLYLGGSDRDQEGMTKWMTGPESGQPLSYTNFMLSAYNPALQDSLFLIYGPWVPWHNTWAMGADGSVSTAFTMAEVTKGFVVEYGGLPATYTITSSATTVNEGSAVTFTIDTKNVEWGTQLSYMLTGISQADLASGSLTGTTIVTEQGKDGRRRD